MKHLRRRNPAPVALLGLTLALGVTDPLAASELQGEPFVSICNQESVIEAHPRVCNTGLQPGRFQVQASSLPAGNIPSGACTMTGLTNFRLAEAQPVLVPAGSCVDLHLQADKPVGMGVNDTLCFHLEANEVGGIQTYESSTIVTNGGIFCAEPTYGSSTVLPQGQVVPMTFTVHNTNPQPETFEYQFQSVGNLGEDPVVSLNGGPAGAPADGQVVVPAFGERQVAVEVTLTEAVDTNQRVLLVDRNSHTVLASRGFISLDTSPCVAGDSTLCVGGGRFEVKALWRDFQGQTGVGHAGGLTSDTGYFWFFNPENIEVVIKVLDARYINEHYWIFFGALSTVEYTLTIRDTLTGESKSYNNPSGVLASKGDISALPGYEPVPASLLADPELQAALVGAVTVEETRPAEGAPLPAIDACTADPYTLCLQGGKFQVQIDWTTATGNGRGRATAVTSETGYFWFFSQNNVEIVIKVLDGRDINDHWWVFFGALSDVSYTVVVTDTTTGVSRTYHNTQGTLASVADLEAFE